MDTASDISQIDDEIIRLKNELCRTKNALTSQIIKRHQLVAELSLKVDKKNNQLKEFQRSNFNDLGKVLRSLYVFESKLRKEQQQIRRQLGERDSVIRQQQIEIAKLRQNLANLCHKNETREETEISISKPDLITSISSQSHLNEHVKNNDGDSPSNSEKLIVLPPKLEGPRKNVLPVDTRTKKNSNNNINFNKNVYSKTVTDLSLNDISSFPNPTPNNNLFVVSNSIFSKNEFTYNEVSKEVITSVKQNGKVITSALKKADKYPSPKSVHFGKTTHIPEPDDDGQTDIVKTVETLLLQECGDSTESENDTSSTASTETSPSVSQMVRKFESICTTAATTSGSATGSESRGADGRSPIPADIRGGGGGGSDGSYIADADLRTAAELNVRTDSEPDVCGGGCAAVSLSDLDPRNNFEEFRFEDSDLDKEYGCGRSEADGLEYPSRHGSSSPSSVAAAVSAAAVLLRSAGDDGGCCAAGRVNYESFLEVTGLSQKSIITVQSNRNAYGSHRNVKKPKDVKSRNRAKSASFDCKSAYPAAVKYWTEPYL
ncbi:uncharacterized protein LOC100573110 [Acyrthosiphon pisum]|uniref:Uncharacterized protein n=1 Tax=Acyrthosiphon pisum TaxID=7029 RepID=A0A8R2AD36_ACYPI|nr:uncharacterized protein LOC100573110 [Acyrthosiphon pisum]|eukprot:XP_003247391.1 PREDICTED: uncharacterized protein LOC100573110 isoform X2 [Acyrthosiphon pisum]